MSLVYRAINQGGLTCYVGRTAYTLAGRLGQHRYAALSGRGRTPFHCAIRESGIDAFRFEVLGYFDTESEANRAESDFILRLCPIYNVYDARSTRRVSPRIPKPLPDNWCFEGESWRDVVGYEGRYQISDFGRIRSLPRGAGESQTAHGGFPGRILKPYRGATRLHVALVKGRKHLKRKAVHILVLEAFVEGRPKGYWGCHRNDDFADNRLENLYWGTPKDNAIDRKTNKGYHRHKLTDADVEEIKCLRGKYSIADIANKFSVSRSTISLIHRRFNLQYPLTTVPYRRLGAATPRARLTIADVRAIRDAYGHASTKELAQKYNVTISNVHKVGKHIYWRHVA